MELPAPTPGSFPSGAGGQQNNPSWICCGPGRIKPDLQRSTRGFGGSAPHKGSGEAPHQRLGETRSAFGKPMELGLGEAQSPRGVTNPPQNPPTFWCGFHESEASVGLSYGIASVIQDHQSWLVLLQGNTKQGRRAKGWC